MAAGHAQPDGMPRLPDWNPDMALASMDAVGIEAAVLSVSSPGVFFGDVAAAARLASQINDEAAQIVADQPNRFGFAASLPIPDLTAAVAEAKRAYAHLNADAISLHTNYGGLYLGDPAMEGLLKVLDSLDAVVLIHPTSPVCWPEVAMDRPRPMIEFLLDTTRAVFNLALNGCLTRYPNIRWVVPHAGAALPVMADRSHQYSQAWAQSPEDRIDVIGCLQRLYYDVAGIPLPRALPALLALVSPTQIVYGSDFPFTPHEMVGALATALTEADIAPLEPMTETLRRNADTLFPRFRTLKERL